MSCNSSFFPEATCLRMCFVLLVLFCSMSVLCECVGSPRKMQYCLPCLLSNLFVVVARQEQEMASRQCLYSNGMKIIMLWRL